MYERSIRLLIHQKIRQNCYSYSGEEAHKAIMAVRYFDAVSQGFPETNHESQTKETQQDNTPSDDHYLLGLELALLGVLICMVGVAIGAGQCAWLPECLRFVCAVLFVLCGYGIAVSGTGIFFSLPSF